MASEGIVIETTAAGPLRDHTLSRKGTVSAWPLGDWLLLRGAVEGLATRIGDRVVHASNQALLVEKHKDDVEAVLATHGARLLPPVEWEGGCARLEVAISKETEIPTLLALFPDARLLARRPIRGAEAQLLTEKQASAIVTAFEMGYYESPKRATTGDLARNLGLARSTFEGHLARAERKLIGAMLPLARARTGSGRSEEMYVAFSEQLGLFVRMRIASEGVRGVSLSRTSAAEASRRHPYLERVLDFLRTGEGTLDDIPVDIDIEGFDRAVLDYLRTIPPGETRTYGEVAKALGRRGAARAVGNACAKNPTLIVVPCHRVVPSEGGVGSYAGDGGSETKARLLAIEGVSPVERSQPRKRAKAASGD